jgi:hypothetical protein
MMATADRQLVWPTRLVEVSLAAVLAAAGFAAVLVVDPPPLEWSGASDV